MDKRKKDNLKLNLSKLFFVLFVSACMVLLTYIWFLTDFFNIESIEYFDYEKIEESDLREASGLVEGENIFLVKTSEAVDSMKKLGYVKEASIIRVFPDRLRVYITEREPICIVSVSGGYIYLDEQGVVAEVAEKLTKWTVPLITGLEDAATLKSEAQKLAIEPAWVGNNILGVLGLLKDFELTGRISEINVTKEKHLHIYTNGGSIIKVKDKENIQSRINFLYTFLTENDDRMIVDLTHGGNPTYTPR
ncbi:cell division protein FtsQ/DivIB [Alkalibacter saccharofermentans]|uniref:Cell division septal protein FtsQ n=1 Tax=Alkalibacter saccharofermentans DSM 14828 TaxID=1120975 RepID=A0A1M4UHE1_9FIRM|nr:FtsQ-type POTRA domain-containing protein [Alkalibacter saccharofermentans]SHE56119.1 Cell division septal protein FtsQ [Alkalibacter saccharofermentans DSM 14828]